LTSAFSLLHSGEGKIITCLSTEIGHFNHLLCPKTTYFCSIEKPKLTTDIVDEYAEIMSLKLGAEASEAVLSVFDNLPNIELVTRYYRWFTIKADADDDRNGEP
jgi:hypothetical protein